MLNSHVDPVQYALQMSIASIQIVRLSVCTSREDEIRVRSEWNRVAREWYASACRWSRVARDLSETNPATVAAVAVAVVLQMKETRGNTHKHTNSGEKRVSLKRLKSSIKRLAESRRRRHCCQSNRERHTTSQQHHLWKSCYRCSSFCPITLSRLRI